MYLRILFTFLFTLFLRVNSWCQFSRLNDVGAVSCVDYSPDGTMFLTTTPTRLTIWDRYTKAVLFTKTLTGGHCAKFSKDSPATYIAISSASSSIQILDGAANWTSYGTYDSGHGGPGAVNIDFAANNSLITCGGTNNKLRMWTLSATAPVSTMSYDGTVAQINACTYFSTTQIGTAATNNKLDMQTITPPASITTAFSNGISNCKQIAFSPDSLKMIAACDSGTSKGLILTISSPATITNIITTGAMNTVAYSADGATFCYGGATNILYIINGTSSNNTIMSEFLQNSDILDTDFTNDGLHLIAGTLDGTVYEYAKYCLNCKPGYYQNLTTKTCVLCDSILKGCSFCVNSTKCVQCYQNFIINTGTNTCDTCASLMDGCGTCFNSTQCTYCMSGYYLLTPNYTCVRCQSAMVGCYICNSSSYCYQCQTDYYLDAATNLCKGCQFSIANCVKCANVTYCTSCKIGFYENAGACTICPTNCYACQTATNCTDCVTGYYAFSSGGTVTCTKCATGCLACNATGICKNCADDRYLDAAGSCIQCPYPCLTCNSSGYCLSCEAAYFNNGAGGCTQCISGCVSCNSSSLCLSCSPGFYLNLSDSTCRSCELNITFCMQCSGSACLKCQIGYYLQSSTQCSSCISSMIACISCTSATVCELCAPGYYKTATGTGNSSCQICTLGCATCYTSANCTSCHVGYYLNAVAATCNVCINNCLTCSSATVCLECQIGYRLGTSGACVPCITDIAGCQSCAYNFTASAVWCVSCQLGRYLDTATGLCPYCPANCTSCINSTYCNTCEIGMYPDGTSLCLKCHQNCSQCVGSATNCSSCIAGFYLTGTYSCLSCSAFGCATCNSTTHDCLSCPIGFYLKTVTGPPTKVCENCLLGIANCYICTSSTICKQCSYGYALASTFLSCSPCSVIEGCKHCTNLSSCENCEIGYYLVINGTGFGSCTKCVLGCKECDATGVCTQCFGEYSLQTVAGVVSCKLCELSIAGCLTCSSSATCLTCVSGYYSAGSSCQLCSTPLFACRYCNSSSICTSCQDGFYLSSAQCYKCDLASPGCTICNSSTVCLACQYGLYLSSSQCYKCINNLPNCLYCLNQTECLQCDSGYYIDTGSCLSCQAHIIGCIHCNNNVTCLQCKGGYFLNSVTHLCQQCKQEGCEICVESNALQCVKCNARFYFNGTLNTCVKCRVDITGCLECSSSTVCTKCDPGYYVNSTSKCSLCEDVLYGCSRCSSALSCLQCKSTYYLYSVNNSCIDCKLPMPGCSHCIENTSCQSCYHGYYLSPSFQCIECTQLQGCLSCINSTYCQYCENSYFLNVNDSLCYPCNVIDGCYACTNNVSCSVCGGGYILNDQLLCEPMRVEAHQTIKDLKFVTKYFNETCLVHYLYARDMTYTQSQTINWTKTTKLILQDSKYVQTDLTILKVEWGPNPYTLIFYTNNPLQLNQNNFPFIRRRLLLTGLLAEQYKVNLKMDQATINEILPDFYLPKDLVMDYDIDSPEFVMSYANTNTNLILFSIFGYVVTILFIIKYIVKAVWSVPNSPEMGDIIPQVLALKSPAFMVFPTYLEFLYYCSGYMLIDFPWPNFFFGDLFADKSDVVPETYALYYTNMHIGSTYFLAFIIIVVMGFIMWLVYQSKNEEEKKLNFSIGNVISNIFIFGATFASCACIQGAFLNPFQSVSMNSGFYMIGIALYCIILASGLYSIYHGRKNMFRIRLIIKASLLAIANLSPIYIFSVSVVLDIVLIIVEYNFSRVTRLYPKLWLAKNILCNIALSVLGLMPSAMISLIITSIIVVIVLLMDVFTHIKEYHENSARNKERKRKFQLENNQSNIDINIWNINFDVNNEKYKLQDINIQQKQKTPGDKLSQQARKTGFETTQGSFVSNMPRALKKKQRKLRQDKEKPEIIDPQNKSQVEKIVFDEEQENGNTFVAQNYLG